jgi:hypothetical protein
MKRSREGIEENRVYVVMFFENLPYSVGSFLFSDEEVSLLEPFHMTSPSVRERAVSEGGNPSASVLRKIFEYEPDKETEFGVREHGDCSKNNVEFAETMREPGRMLLLLGTE